MSPVRVTSVGMGVGMFELVGRQSELAAITRVIELGSQSLSGLLLEGDPGIGKTSLWKAGLEGASARGYRVLSAAPSESEVRLPYAVLGDLLDSVPREALDSLPVTLRRAVEVALLRAPADAGPTEQLAVSNAFLRLLRHLAADGPLLLAIDDLQWVDGPSNRVLAFVLRRLEGGPLAVLATARVPWPANSPKDLRKAIGDDHFERVPVDPLSFDAIDDLLLSRLPRALRRPELDQVYAVSGGNPFFALEIGRFLMERPKRVAGEPLPVPGSLADAVRLRVTKLPTQTRDLLVAVAALAHPTEALLTEVDPGSAKALEPAIQAHVLERSGRQLRFTHPLLAAAVYALADVPTRRKWHGRLAQSISDPEELAHHLALATTGPDAGVAAALDRAALSANARGAPDAAAEFAEQACQVTPPDQLREIQKRTISGAEYRLRAGDAPGARALLEGVLRSTSANAQPAAALRLLGNIAFSEAGLAEAERLLNAAVANAGDDDRLHGLIERDLIRVLNQRYEVHEGERHLVRLSEIAERLNDPELVATAVRLRANVDRQSGRPIAPEARELAAALAEGRASLASDGSPGVLHPLMDWGVLLKWSDDFSRARTLFKQVLALSEERDESLKAPALFHLSELESWAGDWLLAAVYAEECRKAVIHSGQKAYARLWLVANAWIELYRGHLDPARTAARDALAIAIQVGDGPYHGRALAVLGSVEYVAGDPAAANQFFEELRQRFAGTGRTYVGIIRSDGDEVETLLALGRLQEAEAIAAGLCLVGKESRDPWPLAVGARCRALVAAAAGDIPSALSAFEESRVEHARLPMPLELGRTLLAHGTVLRRAKRKRAARESLEEALAIFNRLGAERWTARAEGELARVSSGRPAKHSLTPTEARVAALVARGRTNREVAQELFMSVKTVEANLSRIYDKLRVRSRSELAAQIGRPAEASAGHI
jgi:DNA-binding CsgD family transcriptional regulator